MPSKYGFLRERIIIERDNQIVPSFIPARRRLDKIGFPYEFGTLLLSLENRILLNKENNRSVELTHQEYLVLALLFHSNETVKKYLKIEDFGRILYNNPESEPSNLSTSVRSLICRINMKLSTDLYSNVSIKSKGRGAGYYVIIKNN